MKPFTIIAAMSSNGVIGVGGTLPWKLPEDMKHFKETTTGHGIVMGRKTFESIGRSLPNRKNVVLTRDAFQRWRDLFIKHECWTEVDLAQAVEEAGSFKSHDGCQVFVIGGGEIYALALPHATRMIITHVHTCFVGHGVTYFPPVDWSDWKCVSATAHTCDEATASQPRFTIATYVRKDRG